jgi:hypothetical protein
MASLQKRVALLVHHLAVASKERDQAISRVDEAAGEQRVAEQRFNKLRSQNKQVIDECASLRSKFAHALSLIKAYQAQIQAQEEQHAAERKSLQQRMSRMAAEQSELQKLVASAATRTKGAMADAEAQTSGSYLDAVAEEQRERAVASQVSAPPIPAPTAAPAPAPGFDPVQSARDAVAQLAALAGTLAAHQVSQTAAPAAENAAVPVPKAAASTASAPAAAPAAPGSADCPGAAEETEMEQKQKPRKEEKEEKAPSSVKPPTAQTSTGRVSEPTQAPALPPTPARSGGGRLTFLAKGGDHDRDSSSGSDTEAQKRAATTTNETTEYGSMQHDTTGREGEGGSVAASVEATTASSPQKPPKKWEQLQRLDWLLRVQSPSKEDQKAAAATATAAGGGGSNVRYGQQPLCSACMQVLLACFGLSLSLTACLCVWSPGGAALYTGGCPICSARGRAAVRTGGTAPPAGTTRRSARTPPCSGGQQRWRRAWCKQHRG